MPCTICGKKGHNKTTCKNIKAHVPSDDDNTCPICYEGIGDTNTCTTECGHKFCMKCMVTHLQRNQQCPICRRQVAPEIERVDSDDEDDNIIWTDSDDEEDDNLDSVEINSMTYDNIFEMGYDDGYDKAMVEGIEKGRTEGIAIGRAERISECMVEEKHISFKLGYTSGHKEGLSQGYDTGYQTGYDIGNHRDRQEMNKEIEIAVLKYKKKISELQEFIESYHGPLLMFMPN